MLYRMLTDGYVLAIDSMRNNMSPMTNVERGDIALLGANPQATTQTHPVALSEVINTANYCPLEKGIHVCKANQRLCRKYKTG